MPTKAAYHRPSVKVKTQRPTKEGPRLYDLGVWRKRRKMHLCRYPFCVRCGESKPISELHCDHVVRYEDDIEKFFGEVQTLCESCHGWKTRTEKTEGYTYRPNVVVVCGPPGAGKSIFVSKQRGHHDIVWDGDREAVNRFGCDLYGQTPAQVEQLNQAFNDLTNQLAYAPPDTSAWLIATDQRRAFDVAVKLGGRLVRLPVDKQQCIERVEREGRGPRTQQALEAIDIWFARYEGATQGDDIGTAI